MKHLYIHWAVQPGDDGLALQATDLVGSLDRLPVPVGPVHEVPMQCQPERMGGVSSFQEDLAVAVRGGRQESPDLLSYSGTSIMWPLYSSQPL